MTARRPPGGQDGQRRQWAGRTVVITGSTSGIGQATAVLFARRGAHVIVHGRDEDPARATAGLIRSRGGLASVVVCDLRRAAAAQELIDHAAAVSGQVDVLVNNAGANVFRGVLDASLTDWADCLDLDLRAVWLCARAAVPVMPAGSAIVNVASNHATSTLPGAFPYNVAKAGVIALTQSLAIELAGRGIRANAVCPGYIDTPINDSYFATFADPGAARRRAEQLHPGGRLGAAEEVARAIGFLASEPDAGFTTGTSLTVDGGRSALLQDPQPPDRPALTQEVP